MKRVILIAAVLALAVWEKEAKATLAEIYFPLNVGNSWTYTNYLGEPDPRRPPPSIELTFTIIGTEEIDGYKYYKFNDYFNIFPPVPGSNPFGNDYEITMGSETLFRYDPTTDTIIMAPHSGSPIAIRYNFTNAEWDPGFAIGLSRLRQDNVTCDVPAGEFLDCINFQFNWCDCEGLDAATYGEYLAPNVGNIKFVMPGGDYLDLLEGQYVTFELKSYTIVPEPSSLLLFGLGGLMLRGRK